MSDWLLPSWPQDTPEVSRERILVKSWKGDDGSVYNQYKVEPRTEGGISYGSTEITRTFPKVKR